MIKLIVRIIFLLTSRQRAEKTIRRRLEGYLALVGHLDPAQGAQPVRVPAMPGIDPDMRDWSLFMILEHNVIVNRSISSIVSSLARGEEHSGPGSIDPKRDVMPSAAPGVEQTGLFRTSVADHLESLSHLSRLCGTGRQKHPVFGDLDAHGWNCMFGFHLSLHLRQARQVVKLMKANPAI